MLKGFCASLLFLSIFTLASVLPSFAGQATDEQVACRAYDLNDPMSVSTVFLNKHLEHKTIENWSDYLELKGECEREIKSKLGDEYQFYKIKIIKTNEDASTANRQSSSMRTQPPKIFRSYVGCFYYDPKNPSANIWQNPSWVWALNPYNTNNYLRVSGYYEEQFFFITEGNITYRTLQDSCAKSIPQGSKVLDIGLFNHAWEITTYRPGFDADFRYFFQGKGELSDFKKIIFFGDSLSDTGGLQKWTRFIPTGAYWNGRFSDGPNWIDHLSSMYPGFPFLNTSYGGLKTADKREVSLSDPVNVIREWARNTMTGNLQTEVSKYLSWSGVRPQTASNNIYGIWVGSNNYLEAVEIKSLSYSMINELLQTEGQTSPSADSYARKVVGDIITSMENLYNHGARHFVVAGLPDIGKTPMARKENTSTIFTYLCDRHNEYLQNELIHFKNKHPDVAHVLYEDVSLRMNAFLSSPERYGFTNSKDACYRGEYWGGKWGEICERPHQHVFYDKVHPTTKGHCWIAGYVQQDMYQVGLLKLKPRNENNIFSYCNGPRTW